MNLITDEVAQKRIAQAERVVVLTGAGISAPSGIPTFRGENGLWTKLSPQELSSFESFYLNTAMVSEWYKHRREIIEVCQPNAGHHALVELAKMVSEFTLVTQNIDGLHQRAGSREVLELHGTIMENYCIRCGQQYSVAEFDEIYNCSSNHIPRCFCGGLIRPNVVWFGESLPVKAYEAAYRASQKAELFLSVGTSAQVRPAADLPLIAKEHGAFLIEINIVNTVLTPYADLFLKGAVDVILPQFNQEYQYLLMQA
ncbi:MAG TPA: NAD-dependent deacylase [Candidatus Marinimicrobia bacterium]|nr:NAD-dependent deacylase [Candidatus Neomarinimicrobiota bacterium]HRS51596.1 NAD-dependent deacylase [Candidatus Neomarinimicrobiota bacterium]HRU92326.1 NAD-dependent deacylase [Candidatus Neomarinimicrobiota bacterium]